MKYVSNNPVEECIIFWRKKQSAISETFGNNTRMRVTHRFKIRSVYHPECIKRLIISII